MNTYESDKNNNNPLVILSGPTAVGKTSLSIALAQKIDGEIISADSMQVYKGMDIGTAKIKEEEMGGVCHHLIDVLLPDANFDITLFCNMAGKCIEDILSRNKIPILVGGTGFYIQGLLYDIDFSAGDNNNEYRSKLEEISINEGSKRLHEMLKEADPAAAAKLHPNDKRRIIRALEYNMTSGLKISEHNQDSKLKISPYNYAYFVLNDKRELIYDSINRRVDKMLENGLVSEVKNLLKAGYIKDSTALQAIGYKEVIEYLEGNIDYDRAAELIKQNTRHFAKRQITWFKREKDVIWLNKNEYDYDNDRILSAIMAKLEERNIVKA